MSNFPAEGRYSLANVFDLSALVETRSVQRVADLCAALRGAKTLGTLVGLPGVGKTWAVQHVTQKEPQPTDSFSSPVLYTTVDVKAGMRSFLINLLNCLGPDYRAPTPDMTRLICCWIHRRMTELIIVDEAERLDKSSWEIIRDIHDRTRCAFLFIGSPGLPRQLSRYPTLDNRLSLSIEMLPLTFDELYAFMRCWQQKRPRSPGTGELFISQDERAEDHEILKALYRVTLGNLRRVQQFVTQAERVAQLNGHYYVYPDTARAVAAMFANGRV